MSDASRGGAFDLNRSASGRDMTRRSQGRYIVRLSGPEAARAANAQARTSAAVSSATRMGVPEARVTKAGKLQFTAGAGEFAAARALGHNSIPVAMSMRSARHAHAAGLIDPGHGLSASTKHPRQARFTSGTFVVVDLTEMNKIAAAFGGVARDLKTQRTSISRAINYGLRRLSTVMKRKTKQWTGLRSDKPFAKAFGQRWATPSFLQGSLTVSSGYTVVTRDYYGATWSRANPGAAHRAWNRPQIAAGTFMASGFKPVFHRTTSARLPITPLWGPNIAREIERHRPEFEAETSNVARQVGAEAARLLAVAVSKARG